MGYATGNTVRAQVEGRSFTGVITGMQGAAVIIRPEAWEDWMTEIYNPTYDPKGCIVIHGSAVIEVIKT